MQNDLRGFWSEDKETFKADAVPTKSKRKRKQKKPKKQKLTAEERRAKMQEQLNTPIHTNPLGLTEFYSDPEIPPWDESLGNFSWEV